MNALERFKAYEHKTFGDAAELYLAEFDGKCKERQVFALGKDPSMVGISLSH